MFNKKSIRSSVMKVINQKINDAQIAFDSEVAELDKVLEQDIKNLKVKCDNTKVEVETKYVNSIIGKII